MYKDRRYVYGDDDASVPIHTHFGHEMIKKMLKYNEMVALINSDTNERLTFIQLAQQTANIAVSLTRMGVRKGDVISVCSEKRFEVMSTILGAVCAGAVFSPVDITYGTVPLLHRVKIAKPKIMFCSSSAYELHKEAFDTVGCVEKYIIYDDCTEISKNQDEKQPLTKKSENKDETQLLTKKSETQPLPKKSKNQDEKQPLTKNIKNHDETQPLSKKSKNQDEKQPLTKKSKNQDETQPLSKKSKNQDEKQPLTKKSKNQDETQRLTKKSENQDETQPLTKKCKKEIGEIFEKIESQDGGVFFSDFIKENVNLDDFMPIPVEGWKDYLFILFSSGTTGLPKGVPWTHVGFLINSLCYYDESFKNSCLLNTREWYYTYGLLYTLGCLRGGSTIVYSSRNYEIDWLKAIQKYKIKILQLAPASVNELIKSSLIDQFDLKSVEMIISSSTPIMAEKVEAVKRRLPSLKNVYQLYGTSEAGSAANELNAKFGARSGSVGVPSLGFVFKVVDLNSEEILGANKRGEIRFKSPCLTPGYLQIKDRSYIDAEGFYKTGDVGYYDDDGYFYIVNRIKELIKYNDISIAPAELEAILEQHPSVLEAGVVGLPSEASGEVPVAGVVVAHGQVTRGELVQFVNQRITYRMRLTGVCFVDILPRGAGAKLDRNALKEMIVKMYIGDQ